jgi:hypothetical protein
MVGRRMPKATAGQKPVNTREYVGIERPDGTNSFGGHIARITGPAGDRDQLVGAGRSPRRLRVSGRQLSRRMPVRRSRRAPGRGERRLNYARRQQFRRLSRAGTAAMGSCAVLLLAMAVADAGAVSAAGVLLVLAPARAPAGAARPASPERREAPHRPTPPTAAGGTLHPTQPAPRMASAMDHRRGTRSVRDPWRC